MRGPFLSPQLLQEGSQCIPENAELEEATHCCIVVDGGRQLANMPCMLPVLCVGR
jgi:hypothetical protein